MKFEDRCYALFTHLFKQRLMLIAFTLVLFWISPIALSIIQYILKNLYYFLNYVSEASLHVQK